MNNTRQTRIAVELTHNGGAGLISKAAAKRDYGVQLQADGNVDGPVTRELRRKTPA